VNLKIHPILAAAIIFGICLLIFTLIRGCNKSAFDQLKLAAIQNDLDSLSLQKERDSMAAEQSKKDFRDSLEFANGQLSLKDVQIEATEGKLNAANARINDLLKRHTPIVPSDTGTTLVPNEYIADCSDCFGELESGQKLVNQYRKQIGDRDAFTDKITVTYNKRITQLEHEKQQSDKLANDYREVAKMAMKKAELRRTVYFSMAAIGKESSLIMGVGAGLMYQDKRKRLFGAVVFGTNQGAMVTANLSFPLSFRRK